MKRTLLIPFCLAMAACTTGGGGSSDGNGNTVDNSNSGLSPDGNTATGTGGGGGGGNVTTGTPASSVGSPVGDLGNNTFPAGASLSPNSAYVHYIGRVEQGAAGGIRFAWPGSGVNFRVTNASYVTVTMVPNQYVENNVMGVLVDGNATGSFTLSDNKTTYSIVVPSGDHVITLAKRTEAGNGQVLLQNLATDGQFEQLAAASGRIIEVVGENAATGYSSDAQAGNTTCAQPANSVADPAAQNALNTFGALTARAFNADWSILAFSGRGLMQNYDGSQGVNLSEMYLRLNPMDAFSNLTTSNASVVVLNVGTNDINYWLQNKDGVQPDLTGFQANYLALLKKVRAANPQAVIVATTGPTISNYQCFGSTAASGYSCSSGGGNTPILTAQETAIKAAVSSFGDSKTSYVKFTPDSTNVAACYMPSAAGHSAVAATLIPAVAQATGWTANAAATGQPAAAAAGTGPKQLTGAFAARPDPVTNPNSKLMHITLDEFPQCHYCSPQAYNANNVGTAACPNLIGTSTPCQGYCHVPDGFVELYFSDPPTGGNHYSDPKPQGFYATTVPRGRWIHSMEHGAVVLSYNCPDGCAAEVAWLQSEYNKYPGYNTSGWVVVTPDPLLKSAKFAATSWTWRATFDALDDTAKASIDCFILQHSFYGRECLADKATAADKTSYPRNCPAILDQYMSTTGG